jgi:small-conductance mechanosensitive channel
MSYDKKHTKLSSIIKMILWILLIFWVTDFDNILAVHLSKISINFGTSKISLWHIVSNAFFLLCAIGGVLWAIAVFDNVLIEKVAGLENNEKSLIKRVFKIFAVFVGIYVVLPTFGVNLMGLSVLGGGLGVGIGLGLQKIASNFISGFIILLDKSIKIGDRVVINGTTGTITEITTRYTVMEAFDGSEIIIPNEQFVTNTIVNQTHSHDDIGLELGISVGYSSDLRLVLELIAQCMKEHPLINQDKSPSIYIKSFAASGIDIFIRAWPKDALNDATTIRNDLSIAFLDKLRANNIEIPFPKLDITMLPK